MAVSGSIVPLLMISLLAERLVEILKPILKTYVKNWSPEKFSALWEVCGLLAGLILAFGTQVNFFSIVGLAGNPWLGKFLAGILAGAGAQWMHEILSSLPYDTVRHYRSQNGRMGKRRTGSKKAVAFGP
ncbi:MAG: hypothetical protein PWQ39_311 [Thermacetogenium sp.]|jgi:hypothetical protein|nr:hypothetical protein [Thermacetogenium sp.]